MKKLNKQKQLLNYWRVSIKNESLIGVRIDFKQYNNYFLPKQKLLDENLRSQLGVELFAKYERFVIKIRTIDTDLADVREGKPKEISVLPLLISPFVHKRIHEHGDNKSSHKEDYIHQVWALTNFIAQELNQVLYKN